MRQALPVVAFEAGGIQDWLIGGHNRFLVPWMDRGQYAARLEQLLLDKSLAQRLGENGSRLANERFGFNQYLDGLEAMFEEIIQEHAPPRQPPRPWAT